MHVYKTCKNGSVKYRQQTGYKMCESRKISNLFPHGGFFFVFDPHLKVLPPTTWNFHDISTSGPLLIGNSISSNNKTYVIYFDLLGTVINLRLEKLLSTWILLIHPLTVFLVLKCAYLFSKRTWNTIFYSGTPLIRPP